MIDAELLALLRCPETGQALRVADQKLVEELNCKIDAGAMKNRAGQSVSEQIDGGLLRADGRVLYPIRNRLPHLLVEEGILLE